MKIKTKKSKKPAIIICSLIFVLAAGASAFALNATQSNNKKENVSTTQPSTATSTPTPSSSDSQTDSTSEATTDNGAKNPITANPTNPATNVNVVIVDASQYGSSFEIRAYADTIGNGTCTYNFKKGGTTFTQQSTATAGASTSSCQTIDIPVNSFPSIGTWSLSITYTSASSTYTGTSATQSISIQ